MIDITAQTQQTRNPRSRRHLSITYLLPTSRAAGCISTVLPSHRPYPRSASPSPLRSPSRHYQPPPSLKRLTWVFSSTHTQKAAPNSRRKLREYVTEEGYLMTARNYASTGMDMVTFVFSKNRPLVQRRWLIGKRGPADRRHRQARSRPCGRPWRTRRRWLRHH